MASSFKIKLKLPPNPNAAAASDRLSSAPTEGASSVADGTSSAMGSEVGDEEAGDEFDELEEDSPPPGSSNVGSRSPSVSAAATAAATSAKGKGTGGRGSASTTPKKAAPAGSPSSAPRSTSTSRSYSSNLTLEEIEALPAAKRRKSLKARGATGPGRGWRKGLKMDQKPVYKHPGESAPTKVAQTTPSSFARPKSSLSREALANDAASGNRSESPLAGHGNAAAASSSRAGSVDMVPTASSAGRKAVVDEDAPTRSGGGGGGSSDLPRGTIRYPAMPSARGGTAHSILAPPKIPTGFLNVAPLDKSGAARPPRAWLRSGREILSLGGRPWMAKASWITFEQSQLPSTTSISGDALLPSASASTVNKQATTPASAQSPAPTPAPPASTSASSPAAAAAAAPPASNVSSSILHKSSAGTSTTARPSPLSNATTLPPPKHSRSSSSSNGGGGGGGGGGSSGGTSLPEDGQSWKGSSAAFAAANAKKK